LRRGRRRGRLRAMDQAAVNQLVSLDEELETILTSFDTSYAWNYGNVKEGLRDLYEKAKRDQWNSTTQLAWETEVDPESGILPAAINPLAEYGPYQRLSAREKDRLRHAQVALQLSQFLHGEQGALIVASQLVGAVPWIDAKYYAGTQTMDEARHVEVFSRYLREKLEWQWPVNDNLKELLDATIKDSRWDFKYLGMQIIIEGLAMAAFGNLFQITHEPLLKELIRYVMKDESRHVAFGVLSLSDYYTDMPAGELCDREDFIIYACELMRKPVGRRSDRRRDGMASRRGDRGRPGIRAGADVPPHAVRARGAEPEAARPHQPARACGVRGPRDHRIRERRSRGAGPHAWAELTASRRRHARRRAGAVIAQSSTSPDPGRRPRARRGRVLGGCIGVAAARSLAACSRAAADCPA